MTRDSLSDSRGTWYPLPGGWVSIYESHVTIPRIDAFPCRAWAPMGHLQLLPYKCTRGEGHGGRHAATIVTATPGIRKVIAVWSSTRDEDADLLERLADS